MFFLHHSYPLFNCLHCFRDIRRLVHLWIIGIAIFISSAQVPIIFFHALFQLQWLVLLLTGSTTSSRVANLRKMLWVWTRRKPKLNSWSLWLRRQRLSTFDCRIWRNTWTKRSTTFKASSPTWVRVLMIKRKRSRVSKKVRKMKLTISDHHHDLDVIEENVAQSKDRMDETVVNLKHLHASVMECKSALKLPHMRLPRPCRVQGLRQKLWHKALFASFQHISPLLHLLYVDTSLVLGALPASPAASVTSGGFLHLLPIR